MKKFKIDVTETSSRTLDILAVDKRNAFAIVDEMYQKNTSFFYIDDVKKKEVVIKSEEDIDSKYLNSVDLVDNDLLVCELEESKYFMFEDAEYSIVDVGMIRKENDLIWITNIFYSDDCPEERDNIIFYFYPTRSYGVLDYQKYKAKTIKEIFLLEKNLYSLYPKHDTNEYSSYFILETNIPFQELTSEIIHKLHNQSNQEKSLKIE